MGHAVNHFGEASREYSLLFRAAYILGLTETAQELLKRVQSDVEGEFSHENSIRCVDSLLSLSSAQKLRVHGLIDIICNVEEGADLGSLVGDNAAFTNECADIFEGFSSDLSDEQQVYAALYVAEFLLSAFQVGYQARPVHDVADLDDLAEPSDDTLKYEKAVTDFYL